MDDLELIERRVRERRFRTRDPKPRPPWASRAIWTTLAFLRAWWPLVVAGPAVLVVAWVAWALGVFGGR